MNTLRSLLPVIASAMALALFACGTSQKTADPSFASHELAAETALYHTGPQQGRPPDALLAKGTRVRLLEAAGSYSRVETEHHGSGWISSDVLRAIETR